jgi:hypothetical protein
MGLPEDWARIEGWIKFEGPVPEAAIDNEIRTKKKNPEIPVLNDYSKKPPVEFWKIFPSNPLPENILTNVLAGNLIELLHEKRGLLTDSQFVRGMKAANSLLNGADSCQKGPLPSCLEKNAKKTVLYGEAVTDTVATWVKKGFASGPFDTPPLDNFRSNCLIAIPQNNKVRPVLDASLPEFCSFNSNIDKCKLEKVEMCSARCFAYSVVEAGKGAWMCKMDMADAYKNVPCPLNDLHLQGFSWLGKFFVELRQIFGATTAVANYDILGNTVLTLVKAETEVPNEFVHRQLDDVPVVVPYSKKYWCEEFVSKYRDCCNSLNIQLAEDCPNFDKAFSASQYGKVLGVWFNTADLTWSYPAEKTEKLLYAAGKFFDKGKVSLLQMQKLMGRINDVGLLCPFLKAFKGPLNEMLGELQRNPGLKMYPSKQCKKDLLVWVAFVQEIEKWKPIPHRPMAPPIRHISFSSDAAGFAKWGRTSGKVGVGCVGFGLEGEVSFAMQMFWPEELKRCFDKKGGSFGDKSLFLEFVGLLLPFLEVPKSLANQHVVLKVDNIGCYFAWENKNVSKDPHASVLVRALVLISSYLSCYVHVEHLPRVLAWDAKLCDRLSRDRTTLQSDRQLLNSFGNLKCNEVLEDWLRNPTVDWSLCDKLLDIVKKLV